MDSKQLLQLLTATLDPNPNVRLQAELALAKAQQSSGACVLLKQGRRAHVGRAEQPLLALQRPRSASLVLRRRRRSRCRGGRCVGSSHSLPGCAGSMLTASCMFSVCAGCMLRAQEVRQGVLVAVLPDLQGPDRNDTRGALAFLSLYPALLRRQELTHGVRRQIKAQVREVLFVGLSDPVRKIRLACVRPSRWIPSLPAPQS